jgi:hypothetical protein
MLDDSIADILHQLSILHLREAQLKKELTAAIEKETSSEQIRAKDRYDTTIVIGNRIHCLTRGKSTATGGTVISITRKNVIFVNRDGRQFWRSHNNVEVID